MSQFARVVNELSDIGAVMAQPGSEEDKACQVLVDVGQAWRALECKETNVYFRELRSASREVNLTVW